MHIAIVLGSLTRGGTERVAVNLIDYLIDKGDRVTVTTLREDENEYELNSCANRICWDLTAEEKSCNRIQNFIKRFNKMRNIWKTEKPDVILSFIGKNNFMAILTSWGLKVPVFTSVRAHPAEEYNKKWMRIMASLLFPKSEAVILQTKEQVSFFSKRIQNKAVVLKNPMNPDFMCEVVPYEDREDIIVSVGRVDSNKNHRLLIDAFVKIADKYPSYRMEIFGDGEERSYLIEHVKDLGLQDRIYLDGPTKDVAGKIRNAKCFVLPSNTEGSPNTLIEAMMLGIACISTDCPCGGPAEIIFDGKNGFLTEVGNVGMLSQKLDKLLENEKLQREIASKALLIREVYSPEVVLGQWRKLLENACSKQV